MAMPPDAAAVDLSRRGPAEAPVVAGAATSGIQSQPSPAAEPRGRKLAALALAFGVFSAFLAYYGLLCLFPQWGGDFQMYCAGISRLYRDMLHPLHEAIAVPGEQSTVYTPFLVLLALLGKAVGATPFRVLQAAGLFNLVLLSVGACFLFSRISIHRRWELPAACFIFTTLCLRWLHFGWSSETSLTNLQYIQPYPSTLAWALAFIAFGLLEGLRRKPRLSELSALIAVLAMLITTHVLTASWVIGIAGLYALCAAVQGRSVKPLAWAVGALCLSLLPAVVWPYAPFFGQKSLGAVHEGSHFGKAPWIEFPNLYGLGIVCFAFLWFRFRRHAFWALGLLATLAALLVWRKIGFSFGNRYAFFAAFFPQLVIAEVMALGVFALVGPLTELRADRQFARWDRPVLVALLVLACTVWLPSPMLARAGQTKDWGTLWSPASIIQRPSAHEVYYRQFAEIEPYLSPTDVVLTPVSRAVFDLASITGVGVVSAPNALSVPDRDARARNVHWFFHPNALPEHRKEIARQYGVTQLVVPRYQFALLGTLTESFGEPSYRSARYAVIPVEL